MKILVLGGSGFVGSNLINFLKENHEVTIATRKKNLNVEGVHIAQMDLDIPSTLESVPEYDVVYYLVHSMGESEEYDVIERRQALNLSQKLTSKQKVIYLSGLSQSEKLSKHMGSRHLVGEILANSSATCIEFRASIVIGAQSLSFEMIRAIVERFPIILEAEWSQTLCCPIYIDDLIQYLIKALDLKENEIIEIGGSEEVPYVQLLKIYAQMNDLKRPILKIPKFPKSLVSQTMEIFLPEFSKVGTQLLESITIESTVKTTNYQKFSITPRTIEYAMKKAHETSSKTWEEVSIDELFGTERFEEVKQHLAPAHLVDHYHFFVPFPKIYLKKALDSFLKLYNINPFKKFSLVDFEQKNDHYVIQIKRKSLADFESHIQFSEMGGVTKVEFIHHYHPNGFVDGASYVAFQKFSHQVFETIRKFLPK